MQIILNIPDPIAAHLADSQEALIQRSLELLATEAYRKGLIGAGEVGQLLEFVNFPVQGTSVDVTKLALVALIPYLSSEVKLVMVLHDEIVLEVPEERAQALVDTVRHCMVSAATPILAPIPVFRWQCRCGSARHGQGIRGAFNSRQQVSKEAYNDYS